MYRYVLNPCLLVLMLLIIRDQPEVFFVRHLEALDVKKVVPGYDVNPIANKFADATINDHGVFCR